MNKDQTISLACSILKIVGAALAAHGATNAASIVNSEDVIGVVTAIAGLVWSHYYNATPTPPPNTGNPTVGTQPPKP